MTTKKFETERKEYTFSEADVKKSLIYLLEEEEQQIIYRNGCEIKINDGEIKLISTYYEAEL